MNFDRYIPSRRNVDIEKSNFMIHNSTIKENFQNYLQITPLVQQDINYVKKLRYNQELARVLGIEGDGKVLPYNINYENYTDSEDWPVHARKNAVNKPRIAALDLPNIRTDIFSNVLHWSSSDHLVAALGKIIYLWHVPSSTMTKSIDCSYNLTALKMNIDSTILAYSGEDFDGCEVKLWDIRTSKVNQINEPMDCSHASCFITCIEYHPSNKYVILGCKKGNIVVKTSDMQRISATKNAHNSFDVIKIKCSADGKYIASSGFDGFVCVWSFPHLELICLHKESFCSKGISWHPWKCSYLCIGTTNGSLTLINVSTGKSIAHVKDSKSVIYDINFNKTSAELVVSQTYCERNFEPITFRSQINILSNLHRVVDRFEGHCRKAVILEWSPDGRVLASAGSDETIHLWKFFDEGNKPSSKLEKPKAIFNMKQFIR